MNKGFIISVLLAIVAMMGQAQETESITDTYWRNDATGEWIIGFTPKHVIYENEVWDITNQAEKKNAYTLKLNNGTVIKVDRKSVV